MDMLLKWWIRYGWWCGYIDMELFCFGKCLQYFPDCLDELRMSLSWCISPMVSIDSHVWQLASVLVFIGEAWANAGENSIFQHFHEISRKAHYHSMNYSELPAGRKQQIENSSTDFVIAITFEIRMQVVPHWCIIDVMQLFSFQRDSAAARVKLS